MTLDTIHRPFVWLCPVLTVAFVAAATAHMDYATDPDRRNGAKWLVEHGGRAFNIVIVLDRDAPCVPASRTLLASTRPALR